MPSNLFSPSPGSLPEVEETGLQGVFQFRITPARGAGSGSALYARANWRIRARVVGRGPEGVPAAAAWPAMVVGR